MNMQINITEMDGAPGREIPFSFSVPAEELDVQSDAYTFDSPIRVEGRVTHTGTALRVEGTIAATKHFVCDRCLKACEVTQEHPFSEEFRSENPEEESNVIIDGRIDLRPLVRDTLMAAQPLSNLCKPDCKGLCPVCGHDLNDGDCGCDRFVPDPRLAALQQFMKKED